MNVFDDKLREIIKKNPIYKFHKNLNKENLDNIKYLQSVANKINSSKHSKMLEIVDLNTNSKEDTILDFGCGGGVPLVLLKMAGYNNSYGVDLSNLDINKVKKQNYFIDLFNFNNKIFSELKDGKTNFNNEKFDIIISLQVLEHVKNFNEYYEEITRLLKKQGKLILIFPHRFKPYDSHSKLYFVHYFPKFIRGIFYDLFTNEKKYYYEELLNLKSPFFHKKLAYKHFKNVKNFRDFNLKKFNQVSYDGNVYLKKIFILISYFLPNFFNKFIAIFLLDAILICKNKK